MKLSCEQICQAVRGEAYCEEKDGKAVFHRFSRELETMYRKNAPEFNDKLLATSGISLKFRTDSTRLTLGVETGPGSSRTYFSHDVFTDGKYLDSLKNFNDEDMTGDYPKKPFALGKYEKEFYLGDGEKEVTILFPSLVSSFLTALEIDDGASFVSVPATGRYLALGDSITHGYDSAYPCHRYTHRIAEEFVLTERNLAIGADVFRPEAAELIKEDGVSLVTVAYGSNDWNGLEWETAKKNCEEYLDFLARNLPDVPVYVISPIWRTDCDRITAYGEFSRVEKLLREICARYDNFTPVSGYDLVPHDPSMFGDGSLHPNDEGFSHYASALIEALRRG